METTEERASSTTETAPGETSATPLAYRAVRGGLWVALSSYWTIGFGFVATILLTRLLSPEVFGQFAYAMFFVQLLALSPKLGLNYAFVQHKETNDEAVGSYVVMEILAALGSLLLTLLAVPFLPDQVAPICLVLAAAGLIGVGGVGATLLEKELHLGRTSLIQSIVIPVSYVPSFVLAVRGYGAWSLVMQIVTQTLLQSTALLWVLRRQLAQIWGALRHFKVVLARRFLAFGITVGLALFVGGLLTSLDNFIIGTFVGMTMLGFYDRAYRTAQWPSTLLTNMLSRTSLYTYARLQNDPQRLQKTVTMVLWVISLLALPIALAILVTAPDLLALLYGERWLPSAPFLRILVLVSVIRPLWENANSLFVAIGKPRLMLTFTVIQVLLLAAAGLPLTIAWGALGTCIAVGVAFGVGAILIYRAMMQHVNVKMGAVLGVPALAGVLTVLGYFAFNRLADLNQFALPIRVGIKGFYAVAAYFGITFLVQFRVMRERLTYIWGLFKGQRGKP